MHSYQALKSSNVDGTVEMLRLACAGRQRTSDVAFHYVSTMSVLSNPDAVAHPEDVDLATIDPHHLTGYGYILSSDTTRHTHAANVRVQAEQVGGRAAGASGSGPGPASARLPPGHHIRPLTHRPLQHR